MIDRRSFLLKIAGLRTRYYSGVAPSALADHTDRRAITGVSAGNDRLREIGGVAELGSVVVDVVTRGVYAEDLHDPGIALTRIGRRDAGWSANVTATLETGHSTVYVDRDPSTLTFPTVVHIGLEALKVTAGGGTSPYPDAASPYYMTISTRGFGGTPVLEHLVTARGAGRPQVVDQVVHWRGRRALLSYQDEAGQVVEVVRGILAGTPVMSEDSLVLSVEITPLTALLDQEIPAATRTLKLLDGYHHFGTAHVVEHAQVVEEGFWSTTSGATLQQAHLGMGLQLWPSHLVETLNSTWAGGVEDALVERWLELVLRPAQLDFQATFTGAAKLDVHVLFWTTRRAGEGAASEYNVSLVHTNALGVVDATLAPDVERLVYGLDCFDPETGGNRDVKVGSDPGNAYSIPIRLATAFHQKREASILVTEQIVVPSVGLGIEVRYVDHLTGEEKRARAKVTECVACSPGWLLVLDEASRLSLPSFGNWPGQTAVEIRVAPTLEAYGAGELMLQLLCSGNARNTTYNDLPFGAGLEAGYEVETSSFLRATEATDGWWRLPMVEDETLAEMLEPLLQVTATALVMRRNAAGQSQVALVSVAPEAAVEVVGALDRFQWGSHPVAGAIEEVRTTYAFKLNHDDEGKAQLTIRVQDPGAITRAGREEVLDLDLRGLQVATPRGGDPLAAVLPFAARLSKLYGEPRRTFRCRVSSQDALVATLGAVLTVTSPHAKGSGDSFGLTEVVGRVVAIEASSWEEGAVVTLVSYGGRRSGWAPSARFASVSGLDVTFEANAYSAVTNPYTGEPQQDVDFFEIGDLVRVVVAEDQGTLYLRTITNKVGLVITLDTAPPAGSMRWIRPCSYAAADVRLRKFAFLGQGEIA